MSTWHLCSLWRRDNTEVWDLFRFFLMRAVDCSLTVLSWRCCLQSVEVCGSETEAAAARDWCWKHCCYSLWWSWHGWREIYCLTEEDESTRWSVRGVCVCVCVCVSVSSSGQQRSVSARASSLLHYLCIQLRRETHESEPLIYNRSVIRAQTEDWGLLLLF